MSRFTGEICENIMQVFKAEIPDIIHSNWSIKDKLLYILSWRYSYKGY